jgi:virginiamycin B lyase
MFGSRFFSSWLGNRGPCRRKPARYRPVVQALEDRYLLSTFQEFPLPVLPRDPTDQYHRERITMGPDGNLWFTDGVYSFGNSNEYVGRITPDGSVTEFSVDNNTRTQLYNITTGPDGNLWMLAIRTPNGTNDDQLVVIRMTPDGNYTVFGAFLGHRGEDFVSNVSPLVVGPDGNLWYTASFYSQFPWIGPGNIVGRITSTGDITNFNVLNGALVQTGFGGGITAGADGNLWIGIAGVRPFTPDGQELGAFPRSQPLSEMVTDANGNVWGLVWYNKIERITPDGAVTDFPLPVTPQPFDPAELDPLRMTIAAGPDGNIWFSDPYANQIGNITPDGTVTEYAVPTPDSFPAGITTRPDGNIWFTELGSGQIGELIMNDGSTLSTPRANAAIVEALFAGARPESVGRLSADQQSVAIAADSRVAPNHPEAGVLPKVRHALAESGTRHVAQPRDKLDVADALSGGPVLLVA